jgi:hypothetical protein
VPRTINKYGQTKVTDLAGVPAGGFKNAIINGGMDVWQRGTNFTSVASGSYSADRFIYRKSGAVVHTVGQDSSAPTVAEAGTKYSYSLKLTPTTANTSIAAGDYCTIGQKIEGYNWNRFTQKQFTLSFWVKSVLTGTFCVSFRNYGLGTPDRSYVAEYTVSSSNVWEKKTITVPASPTAGSWDFTNQIGLDVSFAVSCGATYQTTANAWQTGNYLGTSNQVNATASTSYNFSITLVQLEEGSLATKFEPRAFGQELALCQRYCRYYDGTGGSVVGIGTCASTTVAYITTYLSVPMRTSPTITVSNVTHWNLGDIGRGGAVALSIAPTVGIFDPLGNITLTCTVAAGLTAGVVLSLIYASTSARLTMDAEL